MLPERVAEDVTRPQQQARNAMASRFIIMWPTLNLSGGVAVRSKFLLGFPGSGLLSPDPDCPLFL